MDFNAILQRKVLPRIRGYFADDGLHWAYGGVSDWWVAWNPPEPILKRLVLKPGKCFVDIGAHIGRWAIRASRFYESVIAIEPHPEAFRTLVRNRELNKSKNLQAYNLAISDSNGQIALRTYHASSAGSTLESYMGFSSSQQAISVQCKRLDTFLTTTPDVIKIDTQGHEWEVLRGADETLKKNPLLLLEVHLEKDIERIPKLLKEYGYEAKPLLTPLLYLVAGRKVGPN